MYENLLVSIGYLDETYEISLWSKLYKNVLLFDLGIMLKYERKTLRYLINASGSVLQKQRMFQETERKRETSRCTLIPFFC